MTSHLLSERARTVAALDRFVHGLVNSAAYDYIVPVERKGTALVRAGLGADPARSWRRILSSDAIKTVRSDGPAAHILIVDDSVWTGRSLQQTVDAVRSALPAAHITTAAFVTHQEAPTDAVTIAYYRGVDDECYRECREALIEYLQTKGSLLLDTEHLEVGVRISCPTSDFYSALAGWGETVMFASGDRVNCTVLRRADTLGTLFEPVRPTYADLAGAICKLRIVSRPTERNSYSLIPICYPQLHLGKSDEYVNQFMPWTASVGWDQDAPDARLFQCVGLGFSVELALDLMMFLSEALPEQIAFDFSSDGIEHLVTIFPELDLTQVRSRLDRIHARRRPRKTRHGVPDDPGIDILEDLAGDILQLCYDRWSIDTGFVRSIGLSDILQLARLTGHTEARLSAALDVLIDSARILPQLSYARSGDSTLVTRTFVPEGEIVKRKLVRHALGLGKGMELVAA